MKIALKSEAVFKAVGNQLTITLTNLTANPTSVKGSLTAFDFSLTTGSTTGVLNSGKGDAITITSKTSLPTDDGIVTDSTLVTNGSDVYLGTIGWALQGGANGDFKLTRVNSGKGQPDYTIIGPANSNGYYSNAGGSIANNGSHNPFFNQTATFVLTINGLNASGVAIDGVTFRYNTDALTTAIGQKVTSAVPEPSSLALAGLASIAGLAGAIRARRRLAV